MDGYLFLRHLYWDNILIYNNYQTEKGIHVNINYYKYQTT